MTDNSFDPTAIITLETAGQLLGISRKRVSQLVQEGVIRKAGRGTTTISDAVVGYTRYWQAKASHQTKTSADRRVQEARAEEIEQRIAERNRRLVPAEEATAAIDHIIGACAEAFASIPAMISRDVAERNRIEKHVKEAQRGIAKRLLEAARLLREGGKLPDAE